MAFKDTRPVRWLASKLAQDSGVANKNRVAEASPSKKKNNLLKKIGLAFIRGGGSGRDNFEEPEGFDFTEIERAYLTDSYIRTAMDKYVDFIFKAGWDFVGKNPKAVEYVKQRFAAIETATQIPTEQLLIDIAEELVKYHNVFIVKARQPNGYTFPPGIRATPVDGIMPVAGYFLLPTSTITVSRDKNGTIKRYQQEIKGGGGEKPILIKPEDMVHMYVDKPPGRAFGFPFLWEVLDDVKLLRQMEELVDRMIYKHIFPLIVYKVGLEKEGFQSTDEEIEEVREMLGDLTLDGGIVLPERHNISSVGAEGKALSVSEYLNYFERRVFTGLGVSDSLMGRGGANRSTSDNLDAAFKDRIKAYQKIISIFINSFMLKEILLEGGIDSTIDDKNKVEFRFKEIDFDSKIKEENHAIQKFTQNAITHEELRNVLGLDPVTEEDRLYFQMITATVNQLNAANNAGDNKNQPENQHGKKLSPKKKENLSESSNVKDPELKEILSNRWELVKVDTMQMVKNFYTTNPDGKFEASVVGMIAGVSARSMSQIASKYLSESFATGVFDARQQAKSSDPINLNIDNSVSPLVDKTVKHLDKILTKDLIEALNKVIENSDPDNRLIKIVGVFESLKFRIGFLATTETSNAYNVGFAKAAKALGYTEAYVDGSDSDDICAQYNNGVVNLYKDKLPPFHPNCTCKLTLTKKEGSQ